MNEFSFFKYLPSELTRYALSYNSPHEHGKVAITSKDLQVSADDPEYWNSMLKEEYRVPIPDIDIKDDELKAAKYIFLTNPIVRLDKYLIFDNAGKEYVFSKEPSFYHPYMRFLFEPGGV